MASGSQKPRRRLPRAPSLMRKYSDKEWTTFRDMYESYNILWDESLKGYQDETSKDCLYNLLALRMHETVPDIKKRIKSVRTHFSQAKVAYLRNESLEGRPKWWFQEFQFLYPFTGVRAREEMRKSRSELNRKSSVDQTTETEGRNYVVTPMASPLSSPAPQLTDGIPKSPDPALKSPRAKFMYVHAACSTVQTLEKDDPLSIFGEERRGIIPQFRFRQVENALIQRPQPLEIYSVTPRLVGEQPKKVKARAKWIKYPVDAPWDVENTMTWSLYDKWYMPLSASEKPTMHWEKIPSADVKHQELMQLNGPYIQHCAEVVSQPYDNLDNVTVGDAVCLPVNETFQRYHVASSKAKDPRQTLLTEYYFPDETIFTRNKTVRFPLIPDDELNITTVVKLHQEGLLERSTSDYNVELHIADLRFPVKVEIPEPLLIPLSRRLHDIHVMTALIPTYRVAMEPSATRDAAVVAQEQAALMARLSKKFNYHAWVKQAVELVDKRKNLKERQSKPKTEKYGNITATVFRFDKSVYHDWIAGTKLEGTEE